MSLFGAIQQGSSGLQAAQFGLQVVGNNVANANTPGYIRQRLDLTPTIATREGNLTFGHGVRATGVTQVVDKALIERMFTANSAVAGGEMLNKAYSQLENLIGDVEGSPISEQLTSFNNALHDLSTQPSDASLRDFVILKGDSLAQSIRDVYQKVQDQKIQFDSSLEGMSDQINKQLERIAKLNVQIATVEGGGVLGSDGTGLREQRYAAIQELSNYIDVNIQEQPSGAISVFAGGDYLVADGNFRQVYSTYSEKSGGFEVRIQQTDSPLKTVGGQLGASIQARNEIFGSFLDNIDSLAQGLMRAVNEVHSQGQGRKGFTEITSESRGKNNVPLRDAGLPYDPKNGTFTVNVYDDQGKELSKNTINVRELNQVGDSTLQSIADQISTIPGIQAKVTAEGRFSIESNANVKFTFGEDTSGFLSAMGLNTFFTGQGASDIQVNGLLKNNSDYLAISRGGIGADTVTLTSMMDLVDKPLDSLGGKSVRGIYDATVAQLGQKVNLQKSVTSGANDFYSTLQSQHMAITGVNIDEESIKLISYNRAFQASARVISTASEMLDLLMKI